MATNTSMISQREMSEGEFIKFLFKLCLLLAEIFAKFEAGAERANTTRHKLLASGIKDWNFSLVESERKSYPKTPEFSVVGKY